MMEMLVVFILIAVLAQVAIVTYRKSIEDSKHDRAKAILQEIAIANQRFRTDYPSVTIATGRIDNPPAGAQCVIKKFSTENVQPSILVACGYLEPRTWWTTPFTKNDFDYGFSVCGDATGECEGNLAFMEALEGAGKYYNEGQTEANRCYYSEAGGFSC